MLLKRVIMRAMDVLAVLLRALARFVYFRVVVTLLPAMTLHAHDACRTALFIDIRFGRIVVLQLCFIIPIWAF